MLNYRFRKLVGISRRLFFFWEKFWLRWYFDALCYSFLQDHSFFAVAQKKYAFIYDRDGVEIHRLKAHIEPTRLEFLPYHWLLASVVMQISFHFFPH